MLKRYRSGIFYHIGVSLAIILFASPLFRTLGFEYASLSALATSFWCMLVASKRASAIDTTRLHLLGIIAAECGLYILIPLFTSLLSAIFIPNCSLIDGIVFYIEIVPLTALIAILLGAPIGLRANSNRWRILLVIISWVAWLIVSLLPGYFGPQIFTYGWQYGYFPGFVWDEAMELGNPYWWSRLIVVVVAAVSFFATRGDRNSWKSIMSVFVPIIQTAALLIVALIFIPPQLNIIESTGLVERELLSALFAENITIHYKPNSLTSDEVFFLRKQVGLYRDSIITFYHLPTQTPIDIYLYPSVTELDKYVGTKSASISKPWRNELHLAKENLGSLKHELVHVMLSRYGKFPFAVSYSTGITEGAAEAIEDTYDGIRTADDLAKAIIDLKLAKGVSAVMSFTGFASNASGKSYVLAGSFTSYLISRYGAEKYLLVYHSLDYERVYGKAIEQLEQEWLAQLATNKTTMTTTDTERTRFYFDRKSIIAEPCLRRIGKMTKQARTLFYERNHAAADSVYDDIIRESGRVDAIQGKIRSLMRQGKYREALFALDTIKAAQDSMNKVVLYLLRGDLLVLNNILMDTVLAEWQKAADLQLSGDYYLASMSRILCSGSTSDIEAVKKYLKDLYNGATPKTLFSDIENLQPLRLGDQYFYGAKNYMLAQSLISMGELRKATEHLSTIFEQREINTILSQNNGFSLYFRLIKKRYDEYRNVFSNERSQ